MIDQEKNRRERDRKFLAKLRSSSLEELEMILHNHYTGNHTPDWKIAAIEQAIKRMNSK